MTTKPGDEGATAPQGTDARRERVVRFAMGDRAVGRAMRSAWVSTVIVAAFVVGACGSDESTPGLGTNDSTRGDSGIDGSAVATPGAGGHGSAGKGGTPNAGGDSAGGKGAGGGSVPAGGTDAGAAGGSVPAGGTDAGESGTGGAGEVREAGAPTDGGTHGGPDASSGFVDAGAFDAGESDGAGSAPSGCFVPKTLQVTIGGQSCYEDGNPCQTAPACEHVDRPFTVHFARQGAALTASFVASAGMGYLDYSGTSIAARAGNTFTVHVGNSYSTVGEISGYADWWIVLDCTARTANVREWISWEWDYLRGCGKPNEDTDLMGTVSLPGAPPDGADAATIELVPAD